MTHPILFHLAFPVTNLEETKAFYRDGLGCVLGRESSAALIMNLYGHQIVAHLTQDPGAPQKGIYPRHFGLVFTAESDWQALVERAQQNRLTFYQEPKRRFPGEVTEHLTFFLEDPFGNLLEFKYYHQDEAIFGYRQQAVVGEA
ncbi:MAG: glyoxalase [Oscillatoriales cyanobacterium RM2_1_1]|nr:glyoxalase [Oscillatoriales cyanobacterium SM2_3_0]NJO46052.1 glyoxalase [Oscillatoriales cyanobacterium RM2_1_1]